MRTGWGQRVAAARAVRGQPYPAVGAKLPMRVDLAAAIPALVQELVKLLMELEEGGLSPAFLGLVLVVLVVHGVPFSRCPLRTQPPRVWLSRVISGAACAVYRSLLPSPGAIIPHHPAERPCVAFPPTGYTHVMICWMRRGAYRVARFVSQRYPTGAFTTSGGHRGVPRF